MINLEIIFTCDYCDESERVLLDNELPEDAAYEEAMDWITARGWVLDDVTELVKCTEHE